MRWAFVFCVVLGFAIISDANAQDRPTTGLVYHTTENSSLTFTCKSAGNDIIDCEFTQTFVRLQAKPEELPAALEKARAGFSNEVENTKKTGCKGYDDLLALLDGKGSDPKITEKLATVSSVQRDDMRRTTSALLRFCKSPTMANFEAVVKLTHEKDCRTCRVGSHTFEQRLRRNGTGAWAVVPQAVGECGIVQLDRFEPDHQSGLTFWNYVARKAITNPQGKFLLGTCKDLDQTEYTYSWRSRELAMPCDYITFSVF